MESEDKKYDGVRKNHIETPLERRRKIPKYVDKYEEELKKSLFTEDQKKANAAKNKEQNLEEIRITDKQEVSSDRNWDVTAGMEIKYFDPELSYELTGYRPITMEKGLDFDPDLFRERAITFEKTGKYTEFPLHSKPYKDFWKEEFERCKNGLTIGKYRITGDHYFFLNYYRMQTVVEGATAGEGRKEAFPSFFAKQYEFFHYVEMAEKLHKDVLILKARGLGLSELVASLSVRPYTTNRGYNVYITCYDNTKLANTRDKCWFNLDWLNMNTQGGFRHLRQVVNNIDVKRASLKSVDGTEYGWKSEIKAQVCDTSDKLRGSRLDRLIFEEIGSNPIITETWIKGDALVALGGLHFGTRIGLGCVCAGTKVWTKEGIRKNIEDLAQEDGILGFKNGKSNIEPITYMQEPAYKPCVRITTNFGTLECSEDHPILTRIQHSKRRKDDPNKRERWYEWKFVEAKDVMKYTDRNCIAICDKIDVFGNEKLFDPYLVGLLIGDGSYGKDKTPKLSNCDDDIWDYVDTKYTTKVERGHKTKDGKDYYEKRILNIVPYMKLTGIYGQTKTNKRLPTDYMKLCKEHAAELLAGLFDTDGTVNYSRQNVAITQSSKEILEQIQELLYKFGIYGHITRTEPRLGVGRKDKNPYYTLAIKDHQSFINFYEQIPLRIKYKQENLKKGIEIMKTKSFYKEHLDNLQSGIREAYVSSVEAIGVRRIYNLTANDSHTYLANNFITHNTGGDPNKLGGLDTMFRNPQGYNILPYKNYDTDDGIPEISSFFIPAHKFSLMSAYLDKRGVTDHIKLRKFYEAQRAKLRHDDFLRECAEHCFTPREALSNHGVNVFDSELLAQQIMNLTVHKNDYELPQPMTLMWDRSTKDPYEKVNAFETNQSKLLILEPPKLEADGTVLKNLYVAGIDAIDMGTDQSATDDDVSEFCIVIKKRAYGMDAPKYVALYKERPRDIKVAYDIAHKLLVWYNCKAVLEFTKIGFQEFLKGRGKQDLLMSRPAFAVSERNRRNNTKRLIGVPATQAVINHGLELIANYIADYWDTILYMDILDQLLNYTYEDKRRFDIVAALQMVEIGDEALASYSIMKDTPVSNTWKDFGYYRDASGKMQYGVIPSKYTTFKDPVWKYMN